MLQWLHIHDSFMKVCNKTWCNFWIEYLSGLKSYFWVNDLYWFSFNCTKRVELFVRHHGVNIRCNSLELAMLACVSNCSGLGWQQELWVCHCLKNNSLTIKTLNTSNFLSKYWFLYTHARLTFPQACIASSLLQTIKNVAENTHLVSQCTFH